MGRWDTEEIKDTIGKTEEESYHRERSRSPPRRETRTARNSPKRVQRTHQDTTDSHTWGRRSDDVIEDKEPEPEPEPDFGLSGVLAAETNTVNGVVLKYNEPPEKEMPSKRWRLYVFKSGKPLDEPLKVHTQSWYLFGRDRRVADIPTDHPSCSLQHAVLQYRKTEKPGKDGASKISVRPYLMDLGSTNGTFLNGDKIESQRYYELLPKDVLTFGSSTREFVLLVEK